VVGPELLFKSCAKVMECGGLKKLVPAVGCVYGVWAGRRE
jgi:hypothetical protein